MGLLRHLLLYLPANLQLCTSSSLLPSSYADPLQGAHEAILEPSAPPYYAIDSKQSQLFLDLIEKEAITQNYLSRKAPVKNVSPQVTCTLIPQETTSRLSFF